MTDEATRTLDQAILTAWQAELKATRNPSLKQQLSYREGELLPRFAEHYQQLKALSRQMRRGLQRQWKRSLAGVALLLAVGQAPGLAATINAGGACTLLNAISSANNDTAIGGCAAGSGADRIQLPANSTHVLTIVNNTDYGPTGLPVIRSAITIVGNGAIISRGDPRERSNLPAFRILALGNSSQLTIQNTLISGGRAPFSEIVNQAYGGGVLIQDNSTLSLMNSTLAGNYALSFGGGLHAGAGSNVNVINSTITANSFPLSAACVYI